MGGTEPDAGFYRELLDAIDDRVVRFRVDDLRITYCNAAWAAGRGVVPAALIGARLDEVVSESEVVAIRERLAPLVAGAVPATHENWRETATGERRCDEWIDRVVGTGDGREIISVARDVTDRVRAQQLLVASEQRYRHLTEEASDVVVQLDAEGTVHYVSPAVEALLSFAPDELLGTNYLDIVHPDDVPGLLADRERYLAGHDVDEERVELRLRDREGGYRWFEALWSEMEPPPDIDVVPPFFHVVARDVHDRRLADAELERLARTDGLTGLANRAAAVREIEELLADHRQHGRAAVLFVDLDRFKPVNDRHGHHVGDLLLRAVAERLRYLSRPGDTVARLGGDEFLVIARRLRGRVDARSLAQRVREQLAQPYPVAGFEVNVGASVGVGMVGNDSTVDSVMGEADAAMYRDKQRHRR